MRRASILAAAALAAGSLAARPAGAAPANDSFAAARPIPTVPWSETRSTAGATLERGETQPTCGDTVATVWYRIKATQTLPIGVSTYGSSFDTTLAVYTGSRVSKLTQLECSDDAGTRRQSMLGWVAEAGKTYWIQAGTGLVGGTGRLALRVAYGDKVDGGPKAPTPLFTFWFPYAISAAADTNRQEAGARFLFGFCAATACFAFDVLAADVSRKTSGGGTANVCYNAFFIYAGCYSTNLP